MYCLRVQQHPAGDAESVTEFIHSHGIDAALEHQVNSELSYSLSVLRNANFGKMLSDMDARKGDLHIVDYSLTVAKVPSYLIPRVKTNIL